MKRNRRLFYDGFRIAMAYVGTVVGAGFATGQEILQFFTRYGYPSFWAILISVILFIAVGRRIMFYAGKLGARSYGIVADYIFGKAAPFVNLYLGLTFVLICGAMFAGAGALFQEQWGTPYLFGASVTALLTLLVTLFGVSGILTVNSIIVPCLIAFSLFVFVYVINRGYQPVVYIQPLPGKIFTLFRTGITYASFNLVLSIGVLAPMGGEIRDKGALTLGSFLGGGLLGLLLTMGNYTLLCSIPEVYYREIPQMVTVSQMGSFFVSAYILVIWAEIFTTAVGNLFAIHTIMEEKFKIASSLPTVAATVVGLILCLLGFSNIVSWFYPILGMIGFVLSAIILFQTFRDEKWS
ncbi:MAG: hypothetical protein ACOYEH_07835 [Caldicoprobacterales bacterium]|jgi:uncharacterized membrane protein YkvI|nr:hypothetical protein [Clostridiales bacterium]